MIVLGAGFVGNYLCQNLLGCVGTSRKAVSKYDNLDTQNLLYFDLLNAKSWSVVDNFETILWTFPCAKNTAEQELAIQFYKEKLSKKKVLIFGTTSCYGTAEEFRALGNKNSKKNSEKRILQIVDEHSSLNKDIRTQTEEILRNLGANIFCLSGLWGSEKIPLHWIQKGLIRSTLGAVNLIHLRDILRVVEYWKEAKLCGERVNVSSGVCYFWKYLAEHYAKINLLESEKFKELQNNAEIVDFQIAQKPLKLVSHSKLLKLFPCLHEQEFLNPFL